MTDLPGHPPREHRPDLYPVVESVGTEVADETPAVQAPPDGPPRRRGRRKADG